MKNLIIYISVAIFLLSLSSCGVETLDSAPDAAKQTAQSSLTDLIAVAEFDPQGFGFNSVSEASSATLGDGISVHYMQIPSINIHDLTKDPADLIEDGEEWIFEVMAGGQTKSSIVVNKINGVWTTTELGNPEVVKAISEVKLKHMNENDLDKEAYRVIRIPGLYHYYVSFKKGNFNQFIHVFDREEHEGHVRHAVQSARDVLTDIIDTIKNFESAVQE